MTTTPTPPDFRDGIEAAALGDPAEWAAKRAELYAWTGSAWLSGDDVAEDYRPELYSFLCTLIGYLMCGEQAATVLRSIPTPDTLPTGWNSDMGKAPRDRTRVLLLLKNPIPNARPDLRRWDGIPFVGAHIGLASDGFDVGWQFAAPVGQGGFPDEWFAGWRHLPPPPPGE